MYSLTHDRVIWLTLLNNICSSLDIPMAQFDLDVMTSIQLEELATSSKKLSASIRNSSGPGSEPLAPLRWEQVPAPAAGPWKATAACAGGRWMSSICGKEFQIWDLNEVKASFPVASLPLDLADNDSAMWIHWAYAREDVMSAVISQSSIDGT
ncbi:hypothetical protein DL96DRAFT_498600 [Flagelloscypha sp. PMI_526]|nr:hypothetical protein DL96DRAFT_498600 [Flagelloscypha sp. PMI_526]